MGSQGGFGQSKVFLDLVKSIGEARSKDEEDRIVLHEIETLKRRIVEPNIPKDFDLKMNKMASLQLQALTPSQSASKVARFALSLSLSPNLVSELIFAWSHYKLLSFSISSLPDLHEFLTAAYAEYDIIIWSATSMKWVELKMGQLGVLDNPNYKITALLNHLAMINVQSDSRGIFDCKPLGVIWAQFPEFYNSKNTIMFDDPRRNFVMNPQNGLTIKPFRKAHANRDSDQELVKLTQYLLAIAELDDISVLKHKNWELYYEDNTKRRRHA